MSEQELLLKELVKASTRTQEAMTDLTQALLRMTKTNEVMIDLVMEHMTNDIESEECKELFTHNYIGVNNGTIQKK